MSEVYTGPIKVAFVGPQSTSNNEAQEDNPPQTIPRVRASWQLLREDLTRDFVGTARPYLVNYLYNHINGILARFPDRLDIFSRAMRCYQGEFKNDWFAELVFMQLAEDRGLDIIHENGGAGDEPTESAGELARQMAERYADICFMPCHLHTSDVGGVGIISELSDFSPHGGIEWVLD